MFGDIFDGKVALLDYKSIDIKKLQNLHCPKSPWLAHGFYLVKTLKFLYLEFFLAKFQKKVFGDFLDRQNVLRKSVWWCSWQSTSVFQTKKNWFRKVAKFTVSFSYLDWKEFFISKSGVWVVQGARNQMDRFCSAVNQLQWNLDITKNFLCPSTGKIYEKAPRYNKTLL